MWGFIFPTVLFIGYWIAPRKSTVIAFSVKVCWTAVEWYTMLEIRSSMFIDKINRLFITKPIGITNQDGITKPIGIIEPISLIDPISIINSTSIIEPMEQITLVRIDTNSLIESVTD